MKRTCLQCGARFYDLARLHPACPKCGTDFVEIVRPVSPYQSRKKRSSGFDTPSDANHGGVSPGAEFRGWDSAERESEAENDETDEAPSEDEDTEA